MTYESSKKTDFSIYAQRRNNLRTTVAAQYPKATGSIVLFGALEGHRTVFRQESSFYYYTGISEPGLVLAIELTGKTILYVPQYGGARAQWVSSFVQLQPGDGSHLAIDEIRWVGGPCTGYEFPPFFTASEYEHMVRYLTDMIQQGSGLFTLKPENQTEYSQQRQLLMRISQFIPDFLASVTDISALVAHNRRTKDIHEIDLLYKAVEVTIDAQEAAARAIGDGILECEVQASLEYMMTGACARIAFPSIVASGKNSTVLHYHRNNCVMRDGDLVVIDIGAELGGYAADITRTYPVSGTFTKRQREIYDIVLVTQEYIASIAKPGIWLSNKEKPDESLNHLARKFLQEKGYDRYFPHGIGHFLGLDVHDVGDYSIPLQPGDIITIEPGIYIPEEAIGIRIEDDYWVVEDGVVCLSEGLCKDPREIEKMVQQSFESAQGGCCSGEQDECCDEDESEVQH